MRVPAWPCTSPPTCLQTPRSRTSSRRMRMSERSIKVSLDVHCRVCARAESERSSVSRCKRDRLHVPLIALYQWNRVSEHHLTAEGLIDCRTCCLSLPHVASVNMRSGSPVDSQHRIALICERGDSPAPLTSDLRSYLGVLIVIL